MPRREGGDAAITAAVILGVCGSKDPRYDSMYSWRRSLELPWTTRAGVRHAMAMFTPALDRRVSARVPPGGARFRRPTPSQTYAAINRIPTSTIAAPATRATTAPAGPIFSSRTKPVSAATQTRFITPTAKSTPISAQQQPRQ